MDVLGSENLSSVPQAIQSPTLAARPLSMQAGFWQRSPFSSAGLWSSVEKQRASVHGWWGGDTYTPLGPGGLQTRGLVGQTAQSCLQRKSVSFSLLNANLSAGGICLQSPFLCSSRGILSRFQGESLEISYSLPQSHQREGVTQ